MLKRLSALLKESLGTWREKGQTYQKVASSYRLSAFPQNLIQHLSHQTIIRQEHDNQRHQNIARIWVIYDPNRPIRALKCQGDICITQSSDWTERTESLVSPTESKAFCFRAPPAGDWKQQHSTASWAEQNIQNVTFWRQAYWSDNAIMSYVWERPPITYGHVTVLL